MLKCWENTLILMHIKLFSECIEAEGDFRNEHLKAKKTEIS